MHFRTLVLLFCAFVCVWGGTDRRTGVGEVTTLPPGKVEAPDELQVEGMGGVEHGETYNVGLLIHYII